MPTELEVEQLIQENNELSGKIAELEEQLAYLEKLISETEIKSDCFHE